MNIRKHIASLSVGALLFMIMGVQTVMAGTFTDVPADHWAYEYVEQLVEDDVVDPADTYRPDDALNRAELVKIAVLAAGLEIDTSDGPSFPDDVAEDAWFYDYVETAAKNGVVEGYRDADGALTGLFGPGDTVNRAQATKIMVGAFGLAENVECAPNFEDVASADWYYTFVETAYHNCIVDGYGDGSFGPGDAVTRAQMAKITVLSADPPADCERCDAVECEVNGDCDEGYECTDNVCTAIVIPPDCTVDDDCEEGFECTDGDCVALLVGGGLTVALSADSPVGDTIPKSAASVGLMKLDFTAGSDGAVVLDGLIFHRFGVGSSSDWSNIYLYQGTSRLTSGRSISSDTNNVTFNNLALSVGAGATISLYVRGDAGTNGGNESAFELASVDVVTSNASETHGTFPVQGDTFAIANTASAGTINISKNGTVSNPIVGQKNVKIAEFKLTAASEDQDVYQMNLIVKGTVSAMHLTNFQLKQGTDLVAEVAAVSSKDLIEFILDTPFVIENGENKIFSVYADVGAADPQETIKIYMEENTDLVSIGQVYGYGAQVCRLGSYVGTTCTAGTGYDNAGDDGTDASHATIEGGQVTIAFNGPTAGNVAVNDTDVAFMDFSITSANAIEVKQLIVQVSATNDANTSSDPASDADDLLSTTAANFTDIKIIDADTGSTVMGPNELVTTNAGSSSTDDQYQDVTFTDAFLMDAGETRNFSVTMDIANLAALASEPVYVTLNQISQTAGIRDMNNNYLTSSDIVPWSDIQANSMTILSSSLALTRAASPVDDTFVKGSSGVSLVGLNFAAGQASDVTVTGLTLTGYIDENATGGYVIAANNSVYVKDVVASVALYDSAGNLLSSNAENFTTSGAAVFSGLDWVIPAGSTQKLVVKGNLSTTAYRNSDDEMIVIDIAAATDVTAQNEEGDSITPTGNYANCGGSVCSAAASAQTDITVTNAGTLTVADADTPVYDNAAVAGTDDILVSRYKVTATRENFKITDLTLTQTDTNCYGAVNGVTVKYPTSVDAPTTLDGTATTNITSAGLAHYSGLSFMVKKDDSATTFEVYADTNDTTGGTTAGCALELDVTTVSTSQFKGVGQGSGTSLDYDSATLSSDSNKIYLYKSIPTFATNTSLSPTSVVAATGTEGKIYAFDVTADSKGPIGLYTLTFDLTVSGIETSSSYLATASGMKLYRVDGSGSPIGSALDSATWASSAVAFTFTGGEVIVGAGQTEHFMVKGPVTIDSTAQSSGLSVRLTDDTSAAAYAAAASVSGSQVWSDKSNSSHALTSADWTNGYKVPGLPTAEVSIN